MGIIRKGMRVVSIYEPERVFVIDKSRAGKRVFHEKGAARWYTASELQPARASRKATKPLTRKRLAKVQNERSAAFLGHKKLEPIRPYQPKLSCTECGMEFTRSAKSRNLRVGERPFCSDAHRARYWKRRNAPAKISSVPTIKSTEAVQKASA